MADKPPRALCKERDDSTPLISRLLMFDTIMDNSIDSIYFKDKDFRFIYVNKNKAVRHGIKNPNEMNGKTDFNFISEGNAKKILNDEKLILEKGHPIIGKIEKLTRLDGTITWASSSKYPLYDKNDKIIGIWGISRDITEYESTKEALDASEAKHKAMIENISDIIAIIDQNGIFKYTSPNVKKSFGWLPKNLVGKEIKELIHPNDQERIQKEFHNLLKKEGSLKTTELRYKCKDGCYKNVELMAINLVNDINISGVLMNYHDISDRKDKEAKILYLNYHDVLTGLYNRAFLNEEIKRLDTERQLPLSIIMGDIDDLKVTNDTFGHCEGDELLVEVSKILTGCSRKEDIIARFGGDEFYILLPQTSSEAAQTLCRRINKACENYKSETDKKTFYPSISLGYATKTIASEPIDKILKNAEDFMYRRKFLKHSNTHSPIFTSIKKTIYEKSHETEEHEQRLVKLSTELGQVLNLTDEQHNELNLLCTLHDIGIIGIGDHILLKPAKLTDEEWCQIKKHPEIGCSIIQAFPALMPIAKYILYHHERWDGSGYPQGLIGETTPLLSRILAVVDSYDAMTHDRLHKKTMSKEAAITEIMENARTQFDPFIARIFVEKVLN